MPAVNALKRLSNPVREVGCVKQTMTWLDEAAAALDYAHASGVIYRDVKPANLLLDRDERVQVADFGVA